MNPAKTRFSVPEEWRKHFREHCPPRFWSRLEKTCDRECLCWFLYSVLGPIGKSTMQQIRESRHEGKKAKEAFADALKAVGKAVPALRRLRGYVRGRPTREQIRQAFEAYRVGGHSDVHQSTRTEGPIRRLDLEELLLELEAWKNLLIRMKLQFQAERPNRPDRGKRLKTKLMIPLAAWEIRKCAGSKPGSEPTLNEIAQVLQAALTAHGSEAVATADSLRVAFKRHPEPGSSPAYCLTGRPTEQ